MLPETPEQMQGEGLATFVLKATQTQHLRYSFLHHQEKGDWIKNVLAMAQKMPVSVMICAKSVSDSGFLSACKDVLFLSEEIEDPAIVSHEDLREVISSFDGSGVQLSIVLQDSKTIVSAEQLKVIYERDLRIISSFCCLWCRLVCLFYGLYKWFWFVYGNSGLLVGYSPRRVKYLQKLKTRAIILGSIFLFFRFYLLLIRLYLG